MLEDRHHHGPHHHDPHHGPPPTLGGDHGRHHVPPPPRGPRHGPPPPRGPHQFHVTFGWADDASARDIGEFLVTVGNQILNGHAITLDGKNHSVPDQASLEVRMFEDDHRQHFEVRLGWDLYERSSGGIGRLLPFAPQDPDQGEGEG